MKVQDSKTSMQSSNHFVKTVKAWETKDQRSNAITYKHMSGNKNLSKLLNSCLSGHLAQICKTHGRNAVLHLLHVRNPKDRDLKPRFLFSSFPFSQLCLICSRGLSQCQLCYSSVPPGCQCFNSLPWCWMLTPRVSRKSRQYIMAEGTRFALLDPPQIFTASFEGQFTLKEFYCILHRAAPLFPIPLPSKGRPPPWTRQHAK